MTRDLRLFFWFIVIPVILVAVGGLRLLFVEVGRARETEEASLQTKADAAVKSFSQLVLQTGDMVLTRVRNLENEAEFREFLKDESYLSMAFRWKDGKGLVWPSPTSSVGEEAAFCRRMALVLGPNAHWRPLREGQSPKEVLTIGWQAVPGEKKPRELAWIRVSANEIRGVEIKRSILQQALMNHLEALGLNNPKSSAAHATVVSVTDFLGQDIVPSEVPIRTQMFGRASLAPVFPDWTLSVYWREGNWTPAGETRTALAIGLCLLILLISSLVGGATLLIRAAQRARLEALRKTDFVTTVTHELKTPLTTIRLCADLLESGALEDEASLQRAAHSIVSESDRLSRIVSNVLTVGRLELNRGELVLVDLPLAPLVREVAATVPGFEYRASVPEDLQVHAERLSLQGIFLNLFENAVKYAYEGGPVEVEAERAEDGMALVRVMDRGPGLTKEVLAHAFDQFWRGDNSVVRETGGMGLGLSNARGLARCMGGDLTVSQRGGGGCVFTLRLPAVGITGEGDKT